jgi:hypothetical protein
MARNSFTLNDLQAFAPSTRGHRARIRVNVLRVAISQYALTGIERVTVTHLSSKYSVFSVLDGFCVRESLRNSGTTYRARTFYFSSSCTSSPDRSRDQNTGIHYFYENDAKHTRKIRDAKSKNSRGRHRVIPCPRFHRWCSGERLTTLPSRDLAWDPNWRRIALAPARALRVGGFRTRGCTSGSATYRTW